MIRIKSIAVSFLLIIALVAPAQADRWSVLLGSHHFNGTGFEEINPGLFYTWERRNLGFSAGAFRNSYGRGAVAGTISVPLKRWQTGELSVFGGLAYYRREGRDIDTRISGDVIGIGGLQLRQGYTFFQLIPLDERDSKVLISFGLTWPTGGAGTAR